MKSWWFEQSYYVIQNTKTEERVEYVVHSHRGTNSITHQANIFIQNTEASGFAC
jgi:hypothetical protein